jgi:L-amino acid N-acyltransferase YncA
MSLILRAATLGDISAITDIYSHYVCNSVATFEEVPPSIDEMADRFRDIQSRALPYLVAVLDDRIIGYAYASPYKTRSAYRFTVEDSIYIDADYIGKGYGKLLLQKLIIDCTALGLKQMLAVISSTTPDSMKLHEKFGFLPAGLLPKVGYKFDTWLDVSIMTLSLAPVRI